MDKGWLRLISHCVLLQEDKYIYKEAEGFGSSMLLRDISLFRDRCCVMM